MRDYGVRVFACDPQGPAYIEAFRKAGLRAVAADNRRGYGIQRVQERLKPAKDGRPRLVVLEGALESVDSALQERRQPVSTEQEFASYVYPLGRDGRPTSELPMEENDHGMDAMRYAVMWVEEGNAGDAAGVLAQGRTKGWGVR
jgi:phage terminase large subunit